MPDDRISEGIIEYEVTYPKMDPNSILAELLPTKMVMSFKDNHFATELSAGFGMFKMNVINNGEDHELAQLVKLINERFVVQYNQESAIKALEALPEITVKETGKKKQIAGFDCNEAIVTLHGDSVETFTIYFTNDIHIDHPNWFNQFSGIEGVLMEYQIEKYNLCSRFVATSVTPKEISEDLFNISEDYENINEEEMDRKMLEIFNSFSE